jgi:DNA-damage-inducible protein D
MKTEIVQSLTATFEAHAQQTEGGVEYWLARDLLFLLGYSKWDNFLNVVNKAKTALKVYGYWAADHFASVGEMVDLGSDSQRTIEDIILTQYAYYLLFQRGNQKKEKNAFAQTYFAIPTQRAVVSRARTLDLRKGK